MSDPLGKEEETITLKPEDKINISSLHRILDKDWQPGVGSVTELRDISSMCVGVMRHWRMQGGRT